MCREHVAALVGIGGEVIQAPAHALARRPIEQLPTIAADRAIDSDEESWLKAEINADATLDPLEEALLAFIAEESGTVIKP